MEREISYGLRNTGDKTISETTKSPQAEIRLRTEFSDGDDGIRTHVPVKAKRFRVVLVMTTSIRLPV